MTIKDALSRARQQYNNSIDRDLEILSDDYTPPIVVDCARGNVLKTLATLHRLERKNAKEKPIL